MSQQCCDAGRYGEALMGDATDEPTRQQPEGTGDFSNDDKVLIAFTFKTILLDRNVHWKRKAVQAAFDAQAALTRVQRTAGYVQTRAKTLIQISLQRQ